jgi:hypothetical protein
MFAQCLDASLDNVLDTGQPTRQTFRLGEAMSHTHP